MPRVPMYGGQQVAPAQMPDTRLGVRASAEDFGAGIGQGVQAVGGAIAQMVADETRKANQIAVNDGVNELYLFENANLYDPQNGALSKRGKDAFDQPERVLSEYQKAVDDIESKLGNDSQRIAFRAAAANKRVEIGRTLMHHVAGERQRYDAETTEAKLINAQNAAAANWADQGRVKAEIDRQRAAVTDWAERSGMPPEALQAKLDAVTSNTHEAVLGQMLAGGDDQAAKAYFLANRGEMAGTDVAKWERAVNEAGVVGDAQRQTESIFSKSTDQATALEKARTTITDPKMQDEVVRRLKVRFAEQRDFKVQAQADAYERMDTDLVAQRATLDDLRKRPEWQDMTGAMRVALQERDRQLRTGEKPVTDANVWIDFISQSAPAMSALSKADLLSKYRPYLDDRDWDRALSLWMAAREQVSGGPAKDKAKLVLNEQERINQAAMTYGLMPIGIKPADMSDEQRVVAFRFQQAAVQALEAESARLTRPLKADEADKVIADLAYKMKSQPVYVQDKGWFHPFSASWRPWGDAAKTPLTVKEDEIGRAYVELKKIPVDDQLAIKNALIEAARARQKALTQSELENRMKRVHARYLLGDVVGARAIIETAEGE